MVDSVDKIFKDFEKILEYGSYVGEGFSPVTLGYPKVISTDYPIKIKFKGNLRNLKRDAPKEITFQGKTYYFEGIFIERAYSNAVIGVLVYKVKD